MIVAVALLAISSLGHGQGDHPHGSGMPERVVISATRYFNKLGIVYSNSPSHLYIMREDGTGLRQLTSGEEDDLYPTLSLNGRKIWFWKSSNAESDHASYQLCSIDLDGTHLRRTPTKVAFQPYAGLELALERYPAGTFKFDPNDDDGTTTVMGKDGKPLVEDATLSFCDDGRFAINTASRRRLAVCSDEMTQMIDPNTDTVLDLSGPYLNYGWLGGPLLEANAPDDGKSLAVLDRFGHVLIHAKVTLPKMDKDDAGFYDEVWDDPGDDDAYGLWRAGIFLLTAHHQMSDGGFDYCFRVDLYTGKAAFVGEDELEAVSRDGTHFLGGEYGWVGGYKGAGAAKLCKLYVWDAKKLTKKQIGFRLMTCEGACFVPGG